MPDMKICPEDMVRVLLTAENIPDTAIVTKRTGEQEYTLRHNLTIYPVTNDGAVAKEKTTIEGFFLLGPRGSINQVKANQLLHWHVTAEDLVDGLVLSWEPVPQ